MVILSSGMTHCAVICSYVTPTFPKKAQAMLQKKSNNVCGSPNPLNKAHQENFAYTAHVACIPNNPFPPKKPYGCSKKKRMDQ